MDRRLSMLCIGLIFGGGIGFTIAAGNGVTFDGHDHATHHGAGGHNHALMAPIEVGSEGPIPKLRAEVIKDPGSGWNLHVETENFRFSPKNASTEHQKGEGHAHIYVNGEKLARLYANWYHLAHLPEGDVEIVVTLNANSHQELHLDGEPIRTELTVSNVSLEH